MLLWDSIWVQLLLVVRAHFLGLFLGSFFGGNWVFLGYFNFINPNIWLQGYFHNLDLIYF